MTTSMQDVRDGVDATTGRDHIAKAIAVIAADGPIELRALCGGRDCVETKRFADPAAALNWAWARDKNAKAIYVVLNSFDANRGDAANDAAITRRRWLLVDCDSRRPSSDINATDSELDAAMQVASDIHSYLLQRGVPRDSVVRALSGNGVHLLVRIDLPNDEASKGLVKRCLNRLAEKFDSSTVHVDLKVSNASRVTKLYGTWARKGPHTQERPHRRAELLHVPDQIEIVAREVLEDLASPSKREPGATSESSDSSIPDGQRNDTLYRKGRRLRDLGFDEAGIFAALRVLNNERCRPPLPDSEVASIARSCATNGPVNDVYPTTESGDAEFFTARNGELTRYDHRRDRWLLFDHHIWVPQTNGEVERLALESVRARQRAAEGSKERLKWAAGGESRNRQLNLLALAQNMLPIADAGDKWDLDPWLLGAQNGVIDLRTGTLREGLPDDRITMRVRVSFDPSARCPLWDDTVAKIFQGNEQLIAYFDRFVGYSLTGDCREECLAMCWGGGANGKGTLMNTLAWLLGDYADDLPFSAFELHSRGSIPNDVAKIVGKRFVTASETAETRRLNEARVKALTGRDPITARFLHQEFFTFQPVAKFWLATNHKPIVHDDSDGFWRRLHLIPFAASFVERPDRTLKDKLREEGTGILARAVRGCMAWQREGLDPPDIVRNATRTYRDASLPLARFLDQCCIEQEGARATFGDLFSEYMRWCGKAQDRLGRHEFNNALRAKFAVDPRNTRNVTFVGVGIVNSRVEAEGLL